MIKRIFIIFNLLLCMGMILKLGSLYTSLKPESETQYSASAYFAKQIIRSSVRASGDYQRIFDTQKMINPQGTASGPLNQLVMGRNIVRVQGIFLLENTRYALISVISGTMQGLKKVSIGDKIDELKVISITPRTVELAAPTKETMLLKVYEPMGGQSGGPVYQQRGGRTRDPVYEQRGGQTGGQTRR